MPLYYFDIFNDIVAIGDVGVELQDVAAVREEVRAFQLRVDVRNEAGKRVVTASVLMVIQCVEDRGGNRSVSCQKADALCLS